MDQEGNSQPYLEESMLRVAEVVEQVSKRTQLAVWDDLRIEDLYLHSNHTMGEGGAISELNLLLQIREHRI